MSLSQSVDYILKPVQCLHRPGDAKIFPRRNEIVLKSNQITEKTQILIDYPLEDEFYFPLRKEGSCYSGDLTAGEIIDRVLEIYQEIYQVEAETTTVKPGYLPGMLNRNATDGKYGIYGHDLCDLVLVSVHFNPKENMIDLGIDS